jgi:hypothetical protein
MTRARLNTETRIFKSDSVSDTPVIVCNDTSSRMCKAELTGNPPESESTVSDATMTEPDLACLGIEL